MRVLIDACVLYPTLLRQITLNLADAGLFTPLWSAQILEEWRRAALRTHPEQAEMIAAEIALTRTEWPNAEIDFPETAEESLSLPDENDRHVLAAAISGKSDVILTLNVRDFPASTLARHGMRAEHPDPFILACFHENEPRVTKAVAPALNQARRAISPSPAPRDLLKRSRLPRFAKALAKVG
ncbi:MAG: PIN domain-containing protein [Pseudomonadota bacterium]